MLRICSILWMRSTSYSPASKRPLSRRMSGKTMSTGIGEEEARMAKFYYGILKLYGDPAALKSWSTTWNGWLNVALSPVQSLVITCLRFLKITRRSSTYSAPGGMPVTLRMGIWYSVPAVITTMATTLPPFSAALLGFLEDCVWKTMRATRIHLSSPSMRMCLSATGVN